MENQSSYRAYRITCQILRFGFSVPKPSTPFMVMDQFVVKNPGRLSTGDGREADHNKFQRGTTFWDAASKVIHVKNEVSLNATETVNAKLRFE